MAEIVNAAEPLVCVVVLTWNDTAMTRQCLRQALDNTYGNKKIILVDNGSREPCGRALAAEFPEVELIELPHNKGFSGGGNVGLRRALSLGPKYVLHLNNDAFMQPTAIAHMVRALEEREDAGISHALLLDPGGEIVQFYNASVDRDFAWHGHHNVGLPLTSREWPTIESAFVPACVIMYRAKALETLGLYDETFGTSWEDYDLCLRFADAGWKIVTVGDARAEHRSHQTTGTISPYIVYHMTRNRLICISRFGNRAAVLKRSPRLVRSFIADFNGHGLTNWQAHKSFFLGIWDFLRGNVGERSSFYVAPPGAERKTA